MIEYSEAEESAVLTVRYNGPAFDVTAKGEALSLQVLQIAVSDMAYTWYENAERPNQAYCAFGRRKAICLIAYNN